MHVLFRLRKSRTNPDQAVIYARVSVGGERCKTDFTTGVRLAVADWDAKAQKLRGKREENHTLRMIVQDMFSIYNELLATGQEPSADVVRDIYVRGRDSQGSSKTLLQLYAVWIQEGEKSHLDYKTIRIRRNRHANMLDYLEHMGRSDIMPSEFTARMAEQYWTYLQRRPVRPVGVCHAGKELQALKSVMRMAVIMGEISFSPVEIVRKPTKETRSDISFLTEQEVQRIRDAQLPEHIARARDLFLLQCLTGMDYSDVMSFTVSDIMWEDGAPWISRIRTKGSRRHPIRYYVPLQAEAWDIICRYPEGLPRLQNQPYNRYLKQLSAEVLGGKRVTSHDGRRTFATLCLNRGMSYETVSHMLAHTSTRMTEQYYARVNRTRIRAEAASMLFVPEQQPTRPAPAPPQPEPVSSR